MYVVGLTGGIASGKSVVSMILRDLGAFVIDADEVSREVVLPHTKCWEEVVAAFGKVIVREDLTIDRKKLADLVFENPEKRSILNKLIHPEIMNRIEEKLKVIEGEDPQAMVVIDAALLVEAGAYKTCDKLIVVYAREETKLKRLVNRDGMSRKEAQIRINSQLPHSEKVKVADFVINNEGHLSKTRCEVEEVFKKLALLQCTQDSTLKGGLRKEKSQKRSNNI